MTTPTMRPDRGYRFLAIGATAAHVVTLAIGTERDLLSATLWGVALGWLLRLAYLDHRESRKVDSDGS